MTNPNPQVDAYWLESTDIRRSFDRVSEYYDQLTVIEPRVRQEIADRLNLVDFQPGVILDAGCATGMLSRDLLKRFKRGRVVSLDLSLGMLRQARANKPRFRRLDAVCADASRIPLPDASVDLICSNLMLQWCNDLDEVFREFRRILTPRGLLTFSTLGPDTLTELRQAWRSVDKNIHINRFVDMHDIGDALIRAGLIEPVMDVDYYHVTYARLIDMMKELKSVGAHNMNRGRPRGLTSPRRLAAVEDACRAFSNDNRLVATCEVIFGQAWA
ncbi:MAG: malonyl-ACP O-methyltransferase BioC, partial [Gammaproteobacteria bacterium]